MYQIAIDGPSGAGKSSLAKAAAAKLGKDASVLVMPYGGSTLPHIVG